MGRGSHNFNNGYFTFLTFYIVTGHRVNFKIACSLFIHGVRKRKKKRVSYTLYILHNIYIFIYTINEIRCLSFFFLLSFLSTFYYYILRRANWLLYGIRTMFFFYFFSCLPSVSDTRLTCRGRNCQYIIADTYQAGV
jgi:hypothetical protein